LFSAPAIIFLPRMDEGDHADLDHCRRRSSWSLQNQLIDLKGSIGFVWPKKSIRVGCRPDAQSRTILPNAPPPQALSFRRTGTGVLSAFIGVHRRPTWFFAN
jgi:hypothetical protein